MPYPILSQRTHEQLVTLARLASLPYSLVLGYPRATSRQLDSRTAELRAMGITRVSFAGSMRLGTLDVLGKGYSGVVLGARWRRRNVALKIRRTDSPRRTMASEARLLSVANAAGVGPKLFAHSRNALVMEYVEGMRIGDWLRTVRGRGSATRIRGVLRRILESCNALDRTRLDHGELSMISKHAIIKDDDSAVIIDFESASRSRRVSNVTSATQALVIGSALSIHVRRRCKVPERRRIIELLRDYKSTKSDSSFAALLDGLGL